MSAFIFFFPRTPKSFFIEKEVTLYLRYTSIIETCQLIVILEFPEFSAELKEELEIIDPSG